VQALTKYISSNLGNSELLLKCADPAARFSNVSEFMVKSAEDNAYFVREMINQIITTEALKGENLDAACKINSAVCENYARMKNLSVLCSADRLKRTMTYISAAQYAREFFKSVNESLPLEMCRNICLNAALDKEVYCKVNTQYLTQILLNFLINAIIHGHTDNNRVDIAVSRVPNSAYAEISVIDYGVGIDINRLRKIMNRKSSGCNNGNLILASYRGYGLIVCQILAEALGAKILVSNVERGGAAFILLLKCTDKPDRPGHMRLADPRPALGFREDRMIRLSLAQFDKWED
ncbi:MAG TPA: ATP-binding protein, partial [Candidatus Monoglobus merdigallinarum]|nr:ATP-binding protein [Candidatus Monoglobus merdigallinarum]